MLLHSMGNFFYKSPQTAGITQWVKFNQYRGNGLKSSSKPNPSVVLKYHILMCVEIDKANNNSTTYAHKLNPFLLSKQFCTDSFSYVHAR